MNVPSLDAIFKHWDTWYWVGGALIAMAAWARKRMGAWSERNAALLAQAQAARSAAAAGWKPAELAAGSPLSPPIAAPPPPIPAPPPPRAPAAAPPPRALRPERLPDSDPVRVPRGFVAAALRRPAAAVVLAEILSPPIALR